MTAMGTMPFVLTRRRKASSKGFLILSVVDDGL